MKMKRWGTNPGKGARSTCEARNGAKDRSPRGVGTELEQKRRQQGTRESLRKEKRFVERKVGRAMEDGANEDKW